MLMKIAKHFENNPTLGFLVILFFFFILFLIGYGIYAAIQAARNKDIDVDVLKKVSVGVGNTAISTINKKQISIAN
jgi:hypothetical protein